MLSEEVHNRYNEEYYETHCGPLPYKRSPHWIHFFGSVADHVIRFLRPQRVFDAGCAMGFLVEAFRDRGIEAYGIDISPYAISEVRPDIRPFCRIGSITDPIEGAFDLVACIEVLEHLPESQACTALANLCRASDVILFSSTPTDFAEPTHLNVRPIIYWLNLFAELGFGPDVLFDAGFLTPHAMLLRRGLWQRHDNRLLFSEFLLQKSLLVGQVAQKESLEKERRGMEESLGRLEQQLLHSKTSADHFAASLARETDDRCRLAADHAAMSSRLTESLQSAAVLQERLDATQAQLTDHRVQMKAVQAAVRELTDNRSFLQKHISQLRRQQALSQDVIDRSAHELAHLTQERDRLATDVRAKELRLTQSLEQLAQLREQLAHSQADSSRTRRQMEVVLNTVQELRYQTRPGGSSETAGRLAELREQAASLQALNLQLSQEYNRVQRNLSDILQSPGWKLIERYRRWLTRQQIAHPALLRCYENMLVPLLRRVRNNAYAPTPEPLPPAPPSTEPEALSRHPSSYAKDPDYQRWIDENEPSVEALRSQSDTAASFVRRPLFSIIVPVYRVPQTILEACVASVLEQTYDLWQLCLVHGAPEDVGNRDYLAHVASLDPRVHLRLLEHNQGISANSNAALQAATGEFLVFLDHDDTLAPSALFEAALLLNSKPDADFIYSDHDYLEEDGGLRFNPLFKPDWSPEIMLSANYITHLTIIRRRLVDTVQGFDPATDGAQDWDLFLRVLEHTSRVEHIPRILYHWRVHPASTALNAGAKDYAQAAQLLAIRRHLERTGMPAESEVLPNGLLHIRWKPPAGALVSIIIPSKDKLELLERCISTLRDRTAYPFYEIIIVDNESQQEATREFYRTLSASENIRVVAYHGDFNYSAANNLGARAARGAFLLFLNNDVEITHPDWLSELVGWASHSPIGMVGAKLLRPNGSIQHAGVVVGLQGFAGHPFADHDPLTFGMFGSTGWYRNYLSVTGACMMLRREVFDRLGGFDESFQLCGSDVELGMRAWRFGYRVVYNPFAQLIHHEAQTRRTEIPQADFIISYHHYKPYLVAGDPYWSPNLSLWTQHIGFRNQQDQSALQFVEAFLANLGLPHASPPALAPAPLLAGQTASEEAQFVSWFDFSQEEVLALRSSAAAVTGARSVKQIIWFIPAFHNPFYGGVFTILHFAAYWRLHKGVTSIFAVCGAADSAAIANLIRSVDTGCDRSNVYVLANVPDVADLPGADACIATLWTTAFYALRHSAPRKFYFLQDYEPSFYRAGAASALVESTYRLGFYGIANTVSLRNTYETEFGGKATHFTPCVNTTIFRPPSAPPPLSDDRPVQIFFYARPNHARNAFDLLVSVMRRLKASLGDKVRIVTAGEEWNVTDHNLQGVADNLGILPYQETARLYRESDVGVALMLTRHPSYIPLELMASGCLAITNKNYWTQWLLKHEHNCLLSEVTVSCLAATIQRAVADGPLRRQITATALKEVTERYSDWTPALEQVYKFLCDPQNEAALAEQSE